MNKHNSRLVMWIYIEALLIAVKESSEDSVFKGIPEGHAYVAMGLDMDQFQNLINTLKNKKVIKISRNLIQPGPKFSETLALAKDAIYHLNLS